MKARGIRVEHIGEGVYRILRMGIFHNYEESSEFYLCEKDLVSLVEQAGKILKKEE